MKHPRVLPTGEVSIKPNKSKKPLLPIVVVTTHTLYDERTNGHWIRETDNPRPELKRAFLRGPALFICNHALEIVYELQQILGNDKRFQFQLSRLEREKWHPDLAAAGRRIFTHELIVNKVGYRAASGRQPGIWHFFIDPKTISGASIDDLIPGVGRQDQKLLRWGTVIREFCQAFNANPGPTRGSVAAQILRNQRLYPHARRQVPVKTNDSARKALPGNYYELCVPINTTFESAIFIDQENAHHNAAKEINFPDSNTLLARGGFRGERPLRAETKAFTREIQRPGLFRVRISKPAHLDKRIRFLPPFLRQRDQDEVWIFSNEIPLIKHYGARITEIVASWTATRCEPPDRGIREYARWALQRIITAPDLERQIMKPVLLSLYGILGSLPRTTQRYYYQTRHEREREILRIAYGEIEMHRAKPITMIPVVANVIQRGMVEAETRLRSIEMANYLNDYGITIYSIHADCVIIEDARQIPILPFPWRIKERRTAITFCSTHGFISREGSVLPGIPHARRTKLEAARAPIRVGS